MAEIKKNQSKMTNESLVTWRATLRLISGHKWPAGHRFDTPELDYQKSQLVYSPTKGCLMSKIGL